MENNKREAEVVLEKEETKRFKAASPQIVLEEWIQGCETFPKELPYKEISEKISIGKDFYVDEKVLEKDEQLFSGVCPLVIAHGIAQVWSLSPGLSEYSFEQRLLFFVLDYYLKKSKEVEKKRTMVLIRLMEFASYYALERCLPLIGVPPYARNMLAVMDHSNLSLLPSNVPPLKLVNGNIKDAFGFDTIVQQNLFPNQRKSNNSATLFLSTEMAKSDSVQRYNDFLLDRYEGLDEYTTYLKPKVMKIKEKESKDSDKTYLLSTPQMNLL